MRRIHGAVAAVVCGALALAGCGAGSGQPAAQLTGTPVAASAGGQAPVLIQASPAPLRGDERLQTLTMAQPYRPKPPNGGTDDYRCFIVDPRLTGPAYLTGTQFLPQNPAVVHHAIFFSIPPQLAASAATREASTPGLGWTCFGGDGVNPDQTLTINQAPWLGAWAPGSREGLIPAGLGRELPAGSLVVMQVHYNLLNTPPGADLSDRSSMRLRLAPITSAKIKPLTTVLLTAPVELPCTAAETGGLCDRDTAIVDVMHRFGTDSGRVVSGLQLLCGDQRQGPRPGPTQTCLREVVTPGVVRSVAGHMHLLGRSIKVELNPGTPRARVLLDNHNYNFDNQNASWLTKPAKLTPGDQLKITCTHDAALRSQLPELDRLKARYVVWGEGTSDEMCLGVLSLTAT